MIYLIEERSDFMADGHALIRRVRADLGYFTDKAEAESKAEALAEADYLAWSTLKLKQYHWTHEVADYPELLTEEEAILVALFGIEKPLPKPDVTMEGWAKSYAYREYTLMEAAEAAS